MPDNERRSYRKVYKRLWSDPDFIGMTDSERIMALYVLAGSQTNRIGLFKFSIPLASEDLKRPLNTIRRVFTHVVKVFKWEYDASGRVLWIPSWWKYNPPPKQSTNIKGYLADLSDLPRTALIARFRGNLCDVPVPLHEYFHERGSITEPSTAPSSEPSTARAQPEQSASTPRATHTQTHTQTETQTQTTARAPLVQSPVSQRNVAHFTEIGVHVPTFVNDEFLKRLMNAEGLTEDGARKRLTEWYESIEKAWTGKRIGDEAPKFWRSRFTEWQGTTEIEKPKSVGRYTNWRPTGTDGKR